MTTNATESKRPNLDDAIALALEAHRGVIDRSAQPYILHPMRVMFRCEGEIERIVAVLHDVVEDTGRTFDDLRKLGYSEEVIAALDCVTKREGEGYEQFVERAATNPVARRVKIADIEDNMDVRRLQGITQKDWQRMAKYLAAWQMLKGTTGESHG